MYDKVRLIIYLHVDVLWAFYSNWYVSDPHTVTGKLLGSAGKNEMALQQAAEVTHATRSCDPACALQL